MKVDRVMMKIGLLARRHVHDRMNSLARIATICSAIRHAAALMYFAKSPPLRALSGSVSGTKATRNVLLPQAELEERPMRKTTKFLAGIAAIVITGVPAMAADQDVAGIVTGINRLNSTIAIQRVQSGTVGANTGGGGEEFKVKDVGMMETVHAGDRVTFTTSDSGGAKTITKLDRQK